MISLPNLLLFLVTMVGAIFPMISGKIAKANMNNILAFSGSFLLSITFLHLLPETFLQNNRYTGVLILSGFFLQLLLQKFTHGIEHGHEHLHLQKDKEGDHHHDSIRHFYPVLLGLSLHAFMEGLPLGYNYEGASTDSSLYFAVAAHKLPEAMLISALISRYNMGWKAIGLLLAFSAITPVTSQIAMQLGRSYFGISRFLSYVIPVIAGAFIHISTTIFFESGTKQHLLTVPKVVAILVGVALGLATLIIE
jgi:zinc transporter ZupT